MKPKYTVRLTQELGDDERLQIAQRVAGVTDIDADKIERLLERGLGKDLIKPSGANVANRLASVLAEAGAPVQLVPVTEPEPVSAEAVKPAEGEPAEVEPAEVEHAEVEHAEVERRPEEASELEEVPPVRRAAEPAQEAGPAGAVPESAPVAEDEAVLRPRVETPSSRPAPPKPEESEDDDVDSETPDREPAWAEDAIAAPIEPGVPEPEAKEPEAPEPETEAPERMTGATSATSAPTSRELPPQEVSEKTLHAPPEPSANAKGTPEREPELESEPEVAPVSELEPRSEPVRDIASPPPPEPESRGTGLLGSIGAALLGVGAFLSLGFIADPIGIGIVVLALLALGLSFVGQRRAIWLPGLGALALVVWALANADTGVMATLASNWQWFAMFAGSLLVIVAGAQEAQRGYGP